MIRKKEQIRQTYREMRNHLTKEQVQEWSERICTRLLESELFQKAEGICFYYPLGNEVDLLSVANEALKQGKCISFPRTEGADIRFYQVEDLMDFKEGCFHVMEPVSDKFFAIERPLILTPGLVFDEQKNRMGYGKGYYDRYAAGMPEAVKVGIAYEMQLTEAVPVDSFDIPMDHIITEERIW